MSSAPVSVIISAAGTGSRLGQGVPKSLVQLTGSYLIDLQLRLVLDYTANVAVVVGYRDDLVLEIASKYPDVIFAYNRNYLSTGTAASLGIGSSLFDGPCISLDGDVLIPPSSFRRVIEFPGDVLGLAHRRTSNPVLAQVSGGRVVDLDYEVDSELEWTGIVKADASVLQNVGTGHVFHGLKPSLPFDYIEIDAVEIDDTHDIAVAEERLLVWTEQEGWPL